MENITKFFELLPQLKNDKQQQLAIQVAGIAATTTVLYASYKIISGSNKSNKGLKEIPSPGSSYPYVGHLFSLGELPSKTVSDWHAKLGPIIKLRMGVETWIMVDDPALAHKIFVTNGAETSYRPESEFVKEVYSFGEKGITSAQPGHVLKENRAAALTVLAPKQIVEKYMDSIKQEAYNLVSRLIEASSREESGVDPVKDLELNSMNVIFSACFGRKFETVKDPEFIELSAMVEKAIKLGGVENDLPQFLPLFSRLIRLFTNESERVNFVLNQRNPTYKRLIKEAATRKGPNVVKSLEENGYNFTENEKIIFFDDLLIAGTDTTSVTLLWNFAIMCHHPEIQKKVSAEIDQFIKENGRIPEFSERVQLPYCISVIKECMRLKPTTPFGLPHAVRKDVIVDGYLIPKGATIIANMRSIHTQPKLYSNPQTFNPDRFMNNTKTMQSAANGKLEERDHFNFGFGRRVCPGIYLAEVELFCAFIQVFARSFIEPVNKMPDIENAENGGLTLIPHSYKVKFVKRSDALL